VTSRSIGSQRTRHGGGVQVRKECRHENVPRYYACASNPDSKRNRGLDVEHRCRWQRRTRQVVRGARVPVTTATLDCSRAITRQIRQPVSQSERPADSPSIHASFASSCTAGLRGQPASPLDRGSSKNGEALRRVGAPVWLSVVCARLPPNVSYPATAMRVDVRLDRCGSAASSSVVVVNLGYSPRGRARLLTACRRDGLRWRPDRLRALALREAPGHP
jgi:hypothetical protein